MNAKNAPNPQATTSSPQTGSNETLFPVDVSPWLEWCEGRGHPTVTYNPWHNKSWCLCGDVVKDGRAMTSSDSCAINSDARLWRWGK